MSTCERFLCEGDKAKICGNAEEIDHQLGYFNTTKEEATKFVPAFRTFLFKTIREVRPVCAHQDQLDKAIKRGREKLAELHVNGNGTV